MMGMEEKAGGRPLMLGGWPGKGVSAGDKGKLLYTQHTRDAGRDNGGRNTSTFIQNNNHQKKKKKKQQQRHLWLFLCLRSHFVVQVVALMYHSTHIIPSLMYHYLLMLGTIFSSFSSYTGVDFICGAYLRRHLTFLEAEFGSRGQFSHHCQTTKLN